MSISKIIEKNYNNSINSIKNSKSNKEKRIFISELIGNLLSAGIKFSIRCLAKILGVSRKLIKNVLLNSQVQNVEETRGRKKVEELFPNIESQIKEICENTENVDKSLKDNIIYIDVSAGYIIEKLQSDYKFSKKDCPCENTIRRILRKIGYKIRKVNKTKVAKKILETDDIFENVNKRKKEVKESNENTISYSIDDKATKYIGNFAGGGSSWIEREALDHDTNPEYIVKPFGIVNTKTKESAVFCTTNNSTADFKVDCIEKQLTIDLNKNPNINKLYLFLDNGPENSSRRTLWLYRIIMLAKTYKLTIILVYYPPYHSKYNLIEHFWGVLQKHWNGLIIDNYDKLIGAINSTKWDGINAKGYLCEIEYNKGKKVDKKELKKLIQQHIHYEDKGIEKWSLIITP